MKEKLVIALVIFLATINLGAQSIRIVRTDVDSSRGGFVTATYTFGFDVVVEGLTKINGVAFRLNFTQSKYVKFSEWREGSFGKPYVIDVSDTTNTGSLIIGVSSGNAPVADSIVPKIVAHLEFVVLQTAPNGEISTFEFIQPVATYLDSTGGKVVDLKADPIDFILHGFINVWPGDADNSGVVDHLDFAPITKYMGLGLATKNMRSFKRHSASAIWAAQKVLAWDSAAATYADCDGNGDITVSDMLIVSYNIGLDTNSRGIKNELPPQSEKLLSDDYIRIPVYASTQEKFISAAGSLDFSEFESKFDLVAVENGNFFDNSYCYGSVNNFGVLSFVSISNDKSPESKETGTVLVYLVFKPKSGINLSLDFRNMDLKALDGFGKIFNLIPTTGIKNTSETLPFKVTKTVNNLFIEAGDYQNINVSLYSINGNLIQDENSNGSINFNISNLPPSIYFLKIILLDNIYYVPTIICN